MTDLSKRIAALPPEMRNLLLERLMQEDAEKSTPEAIQALGRETNVFPLSFTQQRAWLLDQLEPGNPTYNISGAIRLTGRLNFPALEQSLTEIVRRHETLRTTFAIVDEQPVQIIHSPIPFPLSVFDLSASPADTREAQVRNMVAAEALHHFDLSQGPLIRGTIYKLHETDYVLTLVSHHIVSDGWSSSVMVKELRALYPAFAEGLPCPLPELTIQYVDYAHWQRTALANGKFDRQLTYWKQQLSGELPTLQLPLDHPRPAMRTYHGATHSLQLPGSLKEKLQALSQQHESTLFMTLLGAFQVLLYRYSRQEDLIVGSPIANRNRLEIEGLIGYFINMLPLRINLSGNPSFREVLSRVNQVAMAAYEHQDLPIEKLVEHIRPTRILDHNPLFQVAFIYQNFPAVNLELSDLKISKWEVEKQVSTLDLTLYLRDQKGGLAATIEYNNEIFDAATIKRMLLHYQSLLEVMVTDPDRHILEFPLISTTRTVEATYRLSPMQEGMLFHSLQSGEAGVYLEQMIIGLREDIDVAKFFQSWQQIIARHPVLRTCFAWVGYPQPLQLVCEQIEVVLDQHDIRGLSLQEQEIRFQNFLQQDRKQGFELTEPPLMRLALFAMGETDYRCVWTFHHAILDGRSFTILLKELFSIYDALCENKQWSSITPPPYQDFIHWLQYRALDDAKSYWKHSLEGFTNPNTLSFGFPEAGRQGYGLQKIQLSDEIMSALKTLAQNHHLTLNTLLQGSWAILLSHYTGDQDIVFGATRAGRHFPIEEANSMVGLFINTLPVRANISPEMSLIELLTTLREQSIAMRPYEHTPLYEIQQWSEIPRGSALFENILVFENRVLNASLQSQGGKWKDREFKLLEQTNYPLTLAAYAESELLLSIEYDLARFDYATVARLLMHLKGLLTFMVTNGLQKNIRELVFLTPDEDHQLLVEWSNTHSKYPPDRCIHKLFETQVRRTPHAIAVSSERGKLTYQELNQRANQLARYLNKLGAKPETIVGICMERSFDMVVGLLGILKTGAAYLPFDPTQPQDRLAFALNDSESLLLLTQQSLIKSLPGYDGRSVYLDTDWPQIAQEETSNPEYNLHAGNLAYVIYTSGSTGKPKGVMIEHRALTHFTEAASAVYGIGTDDRVLQFASISFDASAEEIYTCLTQGATLVLRDDEMLTSAETFLRKCSEWNITVLDLPTAYWHQLTGELSNADVKFPESLRLTIIGGEQARDSSLSEWFHHAPHSVRLVNTYGPTEATVVSTVYEFSPEAISQKVLIGRPLKNTEVYILDKFLQPVPIGVIGELHIGGESLARGYLHHEELTTEKFISNPFSKVGARLYKTGDQARYLADGNIEFLGRIDQQIKIRGFRIELGEIESVISQQPFVRQIVVTVWENQPGNKQLVAYIIPEEQPALSVSELRNILKEKLPDYMIPSHFVFLDTFPLTSSGKINWKALPIPDVEASLQETFVAPRSEVERKLTQIWADVLKLKQVGIYDNFFDLGGHSMLATQVVSRIRTNFQFNLSLRDFFMAPTIAQLAKIVDAVEWTSQSQTTSSSPSMEDDEEIKI